MPPPSASSNEWVPVFRAQAAAMNKMAFKAFFITAFSQTEAAAEHRMGSGLAINFSLIIPLSKNVHPVFILKTF